MKILIVSDTHGCNELYLKLVRELGHLDMIVHCGDIEGSEYLFEKSADCPVKMVSGNNDFFSGLPRECEFDLGRHRVFLTHGHTYKVAFDKDTIIREATLRDADIVMFGHTHRPLVEKHGGITLVNPGSMSYPRQADREPTCIIMNMNNGETVFSICKVRDIINKDNRP